MFPSPPLSISPTSSPPVFTPATPLEEATNVKSALVLQILCQLIYCPAPNSENHHSRSNPPFFCVANFPNLHFPRRPFKFFTMSASGLALTLFLLLFLAVEVVRIEASSNFTPVNGSVAEFLPVLEAGETGIMMMNESRRRLRSFQICALCTCCGGPRGLCLASPCCYAINCHIPNRPFGFCAFTPKTCNCFGCHL